MDGIGVEPQVIDIIHDGTDSEQLEGGFATGSEGEGFADAE